MRASVDAAGAQAPGPVGALDDSRFSVFVPSSNASRHLPATPGWRDRSFPQS